ncbi:hypothetical protein EIP86_005259 [Pleurotus ostreatoroseus]|nr:hypothetical protein EIP86_005259 [Pleurotus ostreatoroseus]
MAAVVSSPFHATSSRPHVSSPLAYGTAARVQSRPAMPTHAKHLPLSSQAATPAHMFPTSRPLRPFPSIASTMPRSVPSAGGAQGRKATKIIEPPKNFKTEFVLDLTQAELGRQD